MLEQKYKINLTQFLYHLAKNQKYFDFAFKFVHNLRASLVTDFMVYRLFGCFSIYFLFLTEQKNYYQPKIFFHFYCKA